MVSTLDAAKRVLVVLLRTLAAIYNCQGALRSASVAASWLMNLRLRLNASGPGTRIQVRRGQERAGGVALSRLWAKPAQLLTHKFTQHALPRLPRSHGGWPGRVPVVNLIRVTTGQSLPECKLTISSEPPLPNEPPLPLES